MSNEAIIEEMFWIAYKEDRVLQLVELAGSYMRERKMDRPTAYDKAFYELGFKFPDTK